MMEHKIRLANIAVESIGDRFRFEVWAEFSDELSALLYGLLGRHPTSRTVNGSTVILTYLKIFNEVQPMPPSTPPPTPARDTGPSVNERIFLTALTGLSSFGYTMSAGDMVEKARAVVRACYPIDGSGQPDFIGIARSID